MRQLKRVASMRFGATPRTKPDQWYAPSPSIGESNA